MGPLKPSEHHNVLFKTPVSKTEFEIYFTPRPEVINFFSCSTQLSIKFQLIIKTKIPTNIKVSCVKSLRRVFIMLINVKMPTIVGILTFMSRINLVVS